jgi:hypothetical protein
MILDEQLQQMLGQERGLSRKRQQLDRRIDYVLRNAGNDLSALDMLDRLIAEELEVSEKRREVQANIDRLRA